MSRFIDKDLRIDTWRKFNRYVRSRGCHLLKNLCDFPNSIMVTGCQRSGTTILSRVINKSPEMVNYWQGRDDELDAALILCGHVNPILKGRYCFQTTYLNECYHEYYDYKDKGYRIIWVLRDPLSVVYSMVNNWERFALNELFLGCGKDFIEDKYKMRVQRYGPWIVKPITKACYAYIGKTKQIHKLLEVFSDESIKIVLYDDMVNNPEEIFYKIFKFIGIEYKNDYIKDIHLKSLNKKNSLSEKNKKYINKICLSSYLSVKKFIK